MSQNSLIGHATATRAGGATTAVAGPRELVVRVRAAGFDRFGRLPARMVVPDGTGVGLAVAGLVVSVGAGVEDFAPGDEVLGAVAPGHALGRDTVVRGDDAVAKPREISFTDAATIPGDAATAYDLTHQIELEPDERLLIVGAGSGAGLMAAQIGRVHTFDVLGAAREDERTLVESTGATFVPLGRGMVDAVRAVAPDGVALVVDLVGGEHLRAAAGLAAQPGRVLSAADPAGAARHGGSALEPSDEATAKIAGVIQYGLVDPHVRLVHPLADVAQAVAAAADPATTGEVVVDVTA